jgi:hypothetical protein
MVAVAYPDTRNLQKVEGVHLSPLTVKDAEKIPAAVLTAIDANGEAVNASDTAGLRVLGRSAEAVDNSDDGKTIRVERAPFLLENNGNITKAHIGGNAYVVDNQTVGLAADVDNDIIAGRILDVMDAGVVVDPRFTGTYTQAEADAAIAAAIAAI